MGADLQTDREYGATRKAYRVDDPVGTEEQSENAKRKEPPP